MGKSGEKGSDTFCLFFLLSGEVFHSDACFAALKVKGIPFTMPRQLPQNLKFCFGSL